MQRFSQRESLLLGYSPQRAFVNSGSSSHPPTKNSDVDFHDVFGGPPRRWSVNDMRYSFSEATESSGLKGDADDDDDDDDWSGLNEKPVFGEASVNRRRTQSDDFFDDIFNGNHSVSSSPRRFQRDPFASAPGSRVQSPAHPLLHKTEPSAASSLPAQFSLPAGFSKGLVELPRSSSLSRFSNQAIQSHNKSRNDIRSSTRRSSSYRDSSLVGEGSSSLATSDEADTGGNLEKDSKSSENETSSSPFQFHFSIYKWASKGVPMVMPHRGRNGSRVQKRTKNEEGSSTNECVATESTGRQSPKSAPSNTDFPSNEHPLDDDRSPTAELIKQENDLLVGETTPDKVDPRQFVEEAVHPVAESETFSSLRDTAEDVSSNTISSHKSEEIEPHPILQTASSEDGQKEIPVLMEQVHKPDLNHVRSFFFDEDLQQGNDEVTKSSGKKESVVKGTKKSSVDVGANKTAKHQNLKRSSSTKVEVNKASFQGSPKNSGDNLRRSKVKGKVKDIVKMFNQEVLCKPTYDGSDLGSQSYRMKEKGGFKAENEASITATKMNKDLQKSDVKNTFSDAPVMMKEDLKQLEKENIEAKTAPYIHNNAPAQDTPASSTGSVSNGSNPTVEDADKSFHENFQMKEITQDEEKEPQPQFGNNHEELQAIDAKIRQWSRGKEGNIRSLLTTMQIVLWPESGWKTVPLVDVIEGNSVKRAYQRALLCLHPDKLQQKGATSHHKYLAAKVFDVLQEAWDHFNSLGSL